jgi:FAD synthase
VSITQVTCTIPSGDEKMLERTFGKLYSVQSLISSGHTDKGTRKFTAPTETIYLKNATFVLPNTGEFYSEKKV